MPTLETVGGWVGGLQAFFCLSQEIIWFPPQRRRNIHWKTGSSQAQWRHSQWRCLHITIWHHLVSVCCFFYRLCFQLLFHVCFVAPPFLTFLPSTIHVNMAWLTEILSPTLTVKYSRSWKRKDLLFFLKRRPWSVMNARLLFLITLSDSRSATPVSPTHSQRWHSPLLWGKHDADMAQSGRSINESEPREKTDMWTAWWCVRQHLCSSLLPLNNIVMNETLEPFCSWLQQSQALSCHSLR